MGMGLVNRVVPVEKHAVYVAKYVEAISQNAPLTIGTTKLAIEGTALEESQRDLAMVQEAVDACYNSNDYAKGCRAFSEKRKPFFPVNKDDGRMLIST
jgi:enoyl-CoA hydratase